MDISEIFLNRIRGRYLAICMYHTDHMACKYMYMLRIILNQFSQLSSDIFTICGALIVPADRTDPHVEYTLDVMLHLNYIIITHCRQLRVELHSWNVLWKWILIHKFEFKIISLFFPEVKKGTRQNLLPGQTRQNDQIHQKDHPKGCNPHQTITQSLDFVLCQIQQNVHLDMKRCVWLTPYFVLHNFYKPHWPMYQSCLSAV